MKQTFNQTADWRTVLWIALAIYLLVDVFFFLYQGRIFYVDLIYCTLLMLAVRYVTKSVPPENEAKLPKNTPMFWGQIGLLVAMILLTGIRPNHIPFWSDMVGWFHNLGENILPAKWFGSGGNSAANILQYFIIPFALLLVLGAKPVELGLGKGYKVWQVCLVVLARPIIELVYSLSTGLVQTQTLGMLIISNAFQNGFFEEFLFRGALQTRLSRLISAPWAILIQALLFGLWHLNSNTQRMNGDILAGAALCILGQALWGFVYGYIFFRTRNLIAPSLLHVLSNASG